MSAPMVEKIANAVLYEGYLLYPYRSSAVKNRQRFNFGVVYPRAYSEAESGTEPWQMETECLALGGPLAVLDVRVRCLRLVDRVVGREGDAGFVPADSIQVDGQTYESWQEAAECEMKLPEFRFAELEAAPVQQRFVHPATRTVEQLRGGAIVRTQEKLECWIEVSLETVERGAGTHACGAETHLAGTGQAEPQQIRDEAADQKRLPPSAEDGRQDCAMPGSFPKGEIPAEIRWGRPPGPRGNLSSRLVGHASSCEHEEADQGVGLGPGFPPHYLCTSPEAGRLSGIGEDCLRHIRVRISNYTPLADEPPANREAVLGRSLLSAHTILQVRGGEFVSLLEPPPQFQEAAAACKNVGT